MFLTTLALAVKPPELKRPAAKDFLIENRKQTCNRIQNKFENSFLLQFRLKRFFVRMVRMLVLQ